MKISSAGFTYLELLASLLIMTVGLIPIMQLMPEAMSAAREVEDSTKSAFLAQGKWDEIRAQIFSSDPAYGFSEDYNDSGNFTVPDAKYKFTVTDDQGDNIKNISVTVWYDEDDNGLKDGVEVGVRLDGKVANRDTWVT